MSERLIWKIIQFDFKWLFKANEINEDLGSFHLTMQAKSANILMCSSFHGLIVEPFFKIPFSRFRSNVSSEEVNLKSNELQELDVPYSLGSYSWLSKEKIENSEELISLFELISKNNAPPSCHLTVGRGGNAFFIHDWDSKGILRDKGYNFTFEYFGSSQNDHNKEIIKFILIQYESRNYGVLPMLNTNEVKFDPAKHLFSFAVNFSDGRNQEGDVFFFGFNGLEYSRKNCIKIINKYIEENAPANPLKDLGYDTTYDVLECRHLIQGHAKIKFLKESDFVYSIELREDYSFGRLKKLNSNISVRINFLNDTILKFNGSFIELNLS